MGPPRGGSGKHGQKRKVRGSVKKRKGDTRGKGTTRKRDNGDKGRENKKAKFSEEKGKESKKSTQQKEAKKSRREVQEEKKLSKRIPCRGFLKGTCSFGTQCRFSHFPKKLHKEAGIAPPEPPPKIKPVAKPELKSLLERAVDELRKVENPPEQQRLRLQYCVIVAWMTEQLRKQTSSLRDAVLCVKSEDGLLGLRRAVIGVVQTLDDDVASCVNALKCSRQLLIGAMNNAIVDADPSIRSCWQKIQDGQTALQRQEKKQRKQRRREKARLAQSAEQQQDEEVDHEESDHEVSQARLLSKLLR